MSAAEAWRLDPEDPGYPGCVTQLDEPQPPALYGCGERELVTGLDHESTVTIVGARRASAYGLRVAQELAAGLAVAGVTVVSGMALGIDAAAHRGALARGGRTIAVLANGPEIAYPPRHRDLHSELVRRGAVIAEQPPGTVARKEFFRARNRIMAALGKVVVIVEAALPSGSLITAEVAGKLGRSVGAVPGQVGARVAEGTNDLIATGAYVVRDVRDVLDLLYDVGAGARREAPVGPVLEPRLAGLLECVEAGAATVDEVAVQADAEPRAVAIGLAELELLGYVAAGASGRFGRSSLRPPGLDSDG